MEKNQYNRYDYLITIILGAGFLGELFSPFIVTRIIAICLLPWTIVNFIRFHRQIPWSVDLFFVCWFLYSGFSLLWAADKSIGIKYMLYNICSIILFYDIYLLSLKANRPVRSIIRGWTLLFIGTFPIALWEIVTNNHLSMSVQNESSSVLNSDGIKIARTFASVTFGNLNNYVLTIIYCLPFVIMGITISRKDQFMNLTRLGYIISLGAMVFVLLINSSRGGLLCLGICLVVTLYFFNHYGLMSKGGIFLILVIFTLLIGLNAQFLFNQIAGRLIEGSMIEDASRLEIYGRGIRILTDSLFLGCGVGNIEISLEEIANGRIAAMHNMFLEFLAQYGVVTFILFLIFQWKILASLIKAKLPIIKCLGVTILCIYAPMCIINSGYLMNPLFWVFWASLLCIAHVSRLNPLLLRTKIDSAFAVSAIK